jgi:hypothetical protein
MVVDKALLLAAVATDEWRQHATLFFRVVLRAV